LQRGDQQLLLRTDLPNALELNQRIRDVAKSGLNGPFVLRQRAALLRFSQLYTGGDPSAFEDRLGNLRDENSIFFVSP
jgi:hypothetical protein